MDLTSHPLIGDEVASIVIACYNQASFLGEAIESCLGQTHPSTEIILVDDGSTDNTRSVASQFPQVRYIFQENAGVSVARNTGLAASTGDFVIFLDGDDRLMPQAASVGVQALQASPRAGFAVGRYRKIDAQGLPSSPANHMCGATDFYLALLKGNVIGMHGAVAYRRAALQAVQGFDRRFRASEDYDIALRITRLLPVHEHDVLVAEYRWHSANMSYDHDFLLRDVLDALKVQWPHASKSPVYAAAYSAGVNNWKRHYGSQILSQVTSDIRTGGFRPLALRRMVTALRIDPSLFPIIARRALKGFRA